MRKLLVLFAFFPLFLFAMNSEDTIVSKQSLIEIKEELKSTESALANANEMINISKRYSDTADNLVRQWLQFLAILLTIVSISGYLGIKFLIQNKRDEFLLSTKEMINKRLTEILNDKEETIKRLIKKHEDEKDVILNSKILIINKEGTNVNQYLEKVLERFSKKGYRKIDIPDLLTYRFKIDFKEFDLVLFDNTNTTSDGDNWNFDQIIPKKGDNEETINKIAEQNTVNGQLKSRLIEIATDVCKSNTAFFFFGKNDGHFTQEIPQYSHLINFSNYTATAYQNIVNLLSFRSLLKEA